MNNSTASGEASVLHRYATFVCALIMSVCCLVGVFGNALSLLIFTRKCMRSPINVLLAGLGVVDLIVVVLAVPVFVMPGIGSFYLQNADSQDVQAFLDRLYTLLVFGVYQINMIAQTCSVWTCVVICLERYLAVCHPFVAQRYSTTNRARMVQAAIFFAAVFYNFVRFFEYTTGDERDPFKRSLRNDMIYFYTYYTALYLLTHFIVPFCFITATNVLILRALKRADSFRQLMTAACDPSRTLLAFRQPKAKAAALEGRTRRADRRSTSVQQRQTSHVIVVVTVMFTLCNVLALVLSIWEAFDLKLYQGPARELAFLLLDLSNTLVVFNSATTFLIYLRYCSKFRRLFLGYSSLILSRHPFCRRWAVVINAPANETSTLSRLTPSRMHQPPEVSKSWHVHASRSPTVLRSNGDISQGIV